MSQLHYTGTTALVTLHTAVSTLPAPTGPSDGGDLELMSIDRQRANAGGVTRTLPTVADLYIDSDGGTVSIPGPVLWFLRAGKWYPGDPLVEDGGPVVVTPLRGFAVKVHPSGDWERAKVVASPEALSGGSVTISLVGRVRF